MRSHHSLCALPLDCLSFFSLSSQPCHHLSTALLLLLLPLLRRLLLFFDVFVIPVLFLASVAPRPLLLSSSSPHPIVFEFLVFSIVLPSRRPHLPQWIEPLQLPTCHERHPRLLFIPVHLAPPAPPLSLRLPPSSPLRAPSSVTLRVPRQLRLSPERVACIHLLLTSFLASQQCQRLCFLLLLEEVDVARLLLRCPKLLGAALLLSPRALGPRLSLLLLMRALVSLYALDVVAAPHVPRLVPQDAQTAAAHRRRLVPSRNALR